MSRVNYRNMILTNVEQDDAEQARKDAHASAAASTETKTPGRSVNIEPPSMPGGMMGGGGGGESSGDSSGMMSMMGGGGESSGGDSSGGGGSDMGGAIGGQANSDISSIDDDKERAARELLADETDRRAHERANRIASS